MERSRCCHHPVYNPVAVSQRLGNRCQHPDVRDLLPTSELPHIHEAGHQTVGWKSVHSKNSSLPEPATAVKIKMPSACISPSKSRGRRFRPQQKGAREARALAFQPPCCRERAQQGRRGRPSASPPASTCSGPSLVGSLSDSRTYSEAFLDGSPVGETVHFSMDSLPLSLYIYSLLTLCQARRVIARFLSSDTSSPRKTHVQRLSGTQKNIDSSSLSAD